MPCNEDHEHPTREQPATIECDRCGEQVEEGGEEHHAIGRLDLCQHCYEDLYAPCDRCGEDAHRSDLRSDLCPDCWREDYFSCCRCGDEVARGDGFYDEDTEEDVCERCGVIRGHDYKPEPQFFGDGPRYLGVELEVENRSRIHDTEDVARDLSRASLHLWYLKHDGSLENGFEIVTHPFSWEWLRDNPDAFAPVFALAEKGFRSYNTSTCGMHVHLSRKAFRNAYHLYKFIEVVHGLEELTLRISQREPNKLREWAKLDYGNAYNDRAERYERETPARVAKKGRQDTERYCGVNLQNRHTVEVRIFRGTLLPASFRKNLEYVVAALEFTRTAGGRELTAERFTAYVSEHRKEYPNLFAFLDRFRFEADAA